MSDEDGVPEAEVITEAEWLDLHRVSRFGPPSREVHFMIRMRRYNREGVRTSCIPSPNPNPTSPIECFSNMFYFIEKPCKGYWSLRFIVLPVLYKFSLVGAKSIEQYRSGCIVHLQA
ncbi:unnamed protein product [Ectocarpus sp. 13 AM-2016]